MLRKQYTSVIYMPGKNDQQFIINTFNAQGEIVSETVISTTFLKTNSIYGEKTNSSF